MAFYTINYLHLIEEFLNKSTEAKNEKKDGRLILPNDVMVSAFAEKKYPAKWDLQGAEGKNGKIIYDKIQNDRKRTTFEILSENDKTDQFTCVDGKWCFNMRYYQSILAINSKKYVFEQKNPKHAEDVKKITYIEMFQP
ncbi:unnamed protein product, partial [marine sediment metagenome]